MGGQHSTHSGRESWQREHEHADEALESPHADGDHNTCTGAAAPSLFSSNPVAEVIEGHLNDHGFDGGDRLGDGKWVRSAAMLVRSSSNGLIPVPTESTLQTQRSADKLSSESSGIVEV
jgi:hypothetical protein